MNHKPPDHSGTPCQSKELHKDGMTRSIPVNDVERNAVDVVEIGNLAYWPPGNALCIFFGPTPVSLADECRAASPVNIIGEIEGDISPFRNIASGLPIGVLQGKD